MYVGMMVGIEREAQRSGWGKMDQCMHIRVEGLGRGS